MKMFQASTKESDDTPINALVKLGKTQGWLTFKIIDEVIPDFLKMDISRDDLLLLLKSCNIIVGEEEPAEEIKEFLIRNGIPDEPVDIELLCESAEVLAILDKPVSIRF